MIEPTQHIENEIDDFNRKGIAFLKQTLWRFFFSLIRPLATTTEIFLRKELGERYFTVWNFLAGGFLIYTSMTMGASLRALEAQQAYGGPAASLRWSDYVAFALGLAWLIAFIVKSIMQFKRAHQRSREGILWHSQSCGYAVVPEFWQPWCPVGLGVLFLIFHITWPGLLLIASGIVSFSMRMNERARVYSRVLDMLDAQIESENLNEAIMKRGNGKSTKGFVAPLPAHVSNTHRENFLRAASRPAPSSFLQPANSASTPAPVPAQPSFIQPQTVHQASSEFNTPDLEPAAVSESPQSPPSPSTSRP
jgi:hypothetical protein